MGASHRLVGPLALSVDAFYIRGVAQLGVPDLNLNSTPQFVLRAEDNRPVYAPAAAIDPATGAISLAASRLNGAFGSVSEVHSFLQSETARACLAPQFGRVAARNSCSGPWVPGLDIRLTVKPGGPFGRQFALSVTALNTLVGIDELLHGSAH